MRKKQKIILRLLKTLFSTGMIILFGLLVRGYSNQLELFNNINVEIKFYITDSGEPDIWGITEKYSTVLTNNNFTYENMLDLCNGRCYTQSDDFINSIENTGTLPPGDYKIEYILWENLELYAEFFGNENFIDALSNTSLSLYSQSPLFSDYTEMHNENVTFINLVDPVLQRSF